MRPVELVIEGMYWDSHIYRGKLFLFHRSGSIITIDWDALIENLKLPSDLNIASECAFKRSDYLYGRNWSLFFSDPEVISLITRKFFRLASRKIFVSLRRLRKFYVSEQDSPFPFPHADALIYYKFMFVAGLEGVYRARCSPGANKYAVSTKVERQWDCATVGVAASYGALAMAASSEGLWDLQSAVDSADPFGYSAPRQLAPNECDTCSFMYHSVYGSSYLGGGYLAEFEKSEMPDSERRFARNLSSIVPSSNIFDGGGYSWGNKDKIYSLLGNEIRIVNYRPYQDGSKINILGAVEMNKKISLVGGGVAAFGAVIELLDGLLVITSDGEYHSLPDEPVRWRVFANSIFYQNQLHVIYDEKMSIFSFNQDYFVEQQKKLFGNTVNLDRRGGARPYTM